MRFERDCTRGVYRDAGAAATCCSFVADPDERNRKSSFLNLILVYIFYFEGNFFNCFVVGNAAQIHRMKCS